MDEITALETIPAASQDDPSPAAASSSAAAVAPRPCTITFGGMSAAEAPRVEVRAWLQRLGPLTETMTDGRVLIEALDQGRLDRRYQVRMELAMPEGVVSVAFDHPSNGAHEDIYVAIRNAFRGARRELEAYFRAHPRKEVP